MRTSRSRRGYALLMTLVLVLLATVAMVGLAQRSLLGALETRDAQKELQRRWATTSVRAALLGRLEDLMDAAERGRDQNGRISKEYRNRPIRQKELSFTLAGIDYQVVITDEQARLNVNRLLEEHSVHEAQRRIGRLVGSGRDRRVKLRPQKLDTQRTGVSAYGQVFDDAAADRFLGQDGKAGLAEKITCWGGGRINVRRASEEVLREACRETLEPPAVRALLAAREENPYRSLDSLLAAAAAEMNQKQQDQARDLLTDASTCHGLWIIARDSRRSWYTLAVSVSARGRVVQWYEFAW